MKVSFFSFLHEESRKDAILGLLGNPSLIRKIQIPLLLKMLNPKKKEIILDAGCGSGFISYEVARISRCIGVDNNLNKNLFYVMKKLSNLTYMKSDVQKMPFEDGTFDKILLSSVLQMVEDDSTVLKECYRVLKKDGVLVLSVPIEYVYIKKLNKLKDELIKIFESKGKGFYGFNEVIKLLDEEGFEVIETEYAPKRLGSFIYEIKLYLCYLMGLSFYHPLIDDVLYPLAYCDKFDKNGKGSELIIKVRKNLG